MSVRVQAVDHPELPPFEMPDRFRHEIAYFMTPAGEAGVPELAADEYFIRSSDARQWYDDGSFSLVSPLDSENQTECELTEEQEAWLEWLLKHEVQHVKVE